jgi:hypothetical protein
MKLMRRIALAVVALALLVGSAVGIDEFLWKGAHAAAVASAVSSAILDPSAIFAARSPGARGSGPLLQTKRERVLPATYVPPGGGPEERVLPGIRERIGEPDLAPPPHASLPLTQAPPPGLAGPAPGGGPPGSGPSTPTGFSPPSFFPLNGPTGQQTPPGGGPPFNPPPTPVPEPSAWLLMILALFGVGAALRRARSRTRASRGACAGSHV